MGHWIAVRSSRVLALVELVADQLPSTPSRKVPQQFGARLVSGAFSGAVIGTVGGALIAGLIAGVVGAVIGTYGGAEVRARLAGAFGRDLPAALIEDAVAILARAVGRLGGGMTKKFDAIIIGAGQAGPSLAGRLTAAGMTVAIIERKLFGGTCVNTGCKPTKTHGRQRLCRAPGAPRRRLWRVDSAATVGIDMKTVKARKDKVTLDSRNGIEDWLGGMERCTVFQRPCALRLAARGQRQWRDACRRPHLHQCRRPRRRARPCRASTR